MNEPLTDLSPMPFGKHKGTPLQDVPASYFHWLWHNGLNAEPAGSPLRNYIERNIDALKSENPDLIWK